MLLERLTDYYGICGAEEAAFINKRLSMYTDQAQEQLFEIITQENGKRFGFPDLSKLSKAFAQVSPDGKSAGPKVWWWLKCRKCGCNYWGNLMLCPACNDKGIRSIETEVVTSSFPPPDTVIRFNKTGSRSTKDFKSCYDCKSRAGSFCWDFGKPNYDCKKRAECPCNECCMRSMEWEKNAVTSLQSAGM